MSTICGMNEGGIALKIRTKKNRGIWITRLTRDAERAFYFYATMVMFLLYVFSRLLSG